MGAKIAERPVKMAQSKKRIITTDKFPLPQVVDAFNKEWYNVKADNTIFNLGTQSRVYGIASLVCVAKGIPSDRPIDFKAMYDTPIAFNVLDPLNTAGSLVLNQDPNAIDYQHITDIVVQGQRYHRSRSCVLMWENPVYIAYSSSAFGYVGRSAYQRALYPLKSFIASMICDDLIVNKAGVLVAKMKPAGSIVTNLMQTMFGQKRNVVKEAKTTNVISISTEEAIESLNLQKLDGPYALGRKNIIENMATGAAMPSKLLLEESFAEGFGEGSEDAAYVAGYIGDIRDWLKPAYDFMDQIVMYRAWNPDFYASLQREVSELKNVAYTEFFYGCKNSFKATWPDLIAEPESERIKVVDVKLKALIAVVEVFIPALDPENKAALLAWAMDNLNNLEDIFQNPMDLDFETLAAYEPPQPAQEPSEPKPFAANDSQRPAKRAYSDAVAALIAKADEIKNKRMPVQ